MRRKLLLLLSFSSAVFLLCAHISYSADQSLNDELIKAVVAGNHVHVADLLKRGADANAKQHLTGWSALAVAAFYGYPEIVTTLVHAGANVNVFDVRRNTPLMRAVTLGPYEDFEEVLTRKAQVTKILLQSGANPYLANTLGEVIWRMPVVDHYTPITAVFEEAGIDDTEEVQLMEAIARADVTAVRKLLESSIDLAYHDAYGWTFTKQAEASGNPTIRKLILDANKKTSAPQR